MSIYKKKLSAQALVQAGSTIAHGLCTTPTMTYVTPTVAQGAGQTYQYTGADSTNIYLAQGTSATSADVTVEVFHSFTD